VNTLNICLFHIVLRHFIFYFLEICNHAPIFYKFFVLTFVLCNPTFNLFMEFILIIDSTQYLTILFILFCFHFKTKFLYTISSFSRFLGMYCFRRFTLNRILVVAKSLLTDFYILLYFKLLANILILV
jgi:hypothetical protein